jgi:transcriptional regulator with XRE-family HTH domain
VYRKYREKVSQDFLKQLGQRIRAARKAVGMSQAELAAAVGKTQNLISRYENGLHAIRITELPELADALNVPPGYFFLSPDDDEMIAMARRLNPFMMETFKGVCRRMLNYQRRFGQLAIELGLTEPIEVSIEIRERLQVINENKEVVYSLSDETTLRLQIFSNKRAGA